MVDAWTIMYIYVLYQLTTTLSFNHNVFFSLRFFVLTHRWTTLPLHTSSERAQAQLTLEFGRTRISNSSCTSVRPQMYVSLGFIHARTYVCSMYVHVCVLACNMYVRLPCTTGARRTPMSSLVCFGENLKVRFSTTFLYRGAVFFFLFALVL